MANFISRVFRERAFATSHRYIGTLFRFDSIQFVINICSFCTDKLSDRIANSSLYVCVLHLGVRNESWTANLFELV